MTENIIVPRLESDNEFMPYLLVEALEYILDSFKSTRTLVWINAPYDEGDLRSVSIYFTDLIYTVCFYPVVNRVFSEAIMNESGELIIFRDSTKNVIEVGPAGIGLKIEGFDPQFLLMLYFDEWKELMSIKIANPRGTQKSSIEFTDSQLKIVNNFISELKFDSSIKEVLHDGSFKMPSGYVLGYDSGGGGYRTLLNILWALLNSDGIVIFYEFESSFHPIIRDELLKLLKKTFENKISIYYVSGYGKTL